MIKKKGFTLIELMGVLIIIGVLTLIIVPVATNLIKNQKQENYERQVTNIILASKNLVSDNLYNFASVKGDSTYINVGLLKSRGYFDRDIVNPKNNKKISDCTRIKITKLKNGYDYEYDASTENIDNCDVNGNITITGDQYTYIKKGKTINYTISVNNLENSFTNYNLVEEEISLTNEIADIEISESSNGIYIVSITAKDKEGEAALKLNSGAITQNGKDLIGSDGLVSSQKFVVDNTAPEINFGTNGNSKWSKTASSTITVNDNFVSDESTYTYIYSANINEDPVYAFVSGNNYVEKEVSGIYYLRARACDIAGNCNIATSNEFKLDNTAPDAPTVALASGSWEPKENNTWYNHDIYVVGNVAGKNDGSKALPSSIEDHSGIAKYEISSDGINWTTWNYSSSNSMYYYKGSGETKRYIRAIDNAGNISDITEKTIKVDKIKPTAPLVKLVSATAEYDNSSRLVYTYGDTAIPGEWHSDYIVLMGTSEDNQPTSTDAHSGIAKYQVSIGGEGYKYSYKDVWTDWDWTLDNLGGSNQYNVQKDWYYRTTSGVKNFYVRAIDQAGNISEETVKVAKNDWQKPKITSFSVGSCSSDGKRKITLNGYDEDSGINGYAITTTDKAPAVSQFNVTTATTWTSGYYDPGTYYVWAIDKVDNVSYDSYNAETIQKISTKVVVGACEKPKPADTTGPTITFGTNGSSSYVKEANTKVTVTDTSGVASIKYGWSTSSTSTTAGTTTTSGSTLKSTCSRTTDGSCYLYVYACDKVGNCSNARTSAFKLDVTAPNIVFSNNGSTSYIAEASTKLTVTDTSGTASIKYGWSTSASSTTVSTTTTSGSNLNSKCNRNTDGNCYLYVYVCDKVGHCTGKRTSAFKLDVEKPIITNLQRSTCKQGIKMSYNVQDTGSGVAQYGDIFCDVDYYGSNVCYKSIDEDRLKNGANTTAVITRRTAWTSSTNKPPVKTQDYSSFAKAIDAVGNVGKASITPNIFPYQGTNSCS